MSATAEVACALLPHLARNRRRSGGCPPDALSDAIHRLLVDSDPERRLPYETRREIYAAAHAAEEPVVTDMLRSLPESELPRPRLPKELQDVPLGVRRSQARGNDPRMLELLAQDQDRMVLDFWLRNPRVVEEDVIRLGGLASRGRHCARGHLRERALVDPAAHSRRAGSQPLLPARDRRRHRGRAAAPGAALHAARSGAARAGARPARRRARAARQHTSLGGAVSSGRSGRGHHLRRQRGAADRATGERCGLPGDHLRPGAGPAHRSAGQRGPARPGLRLRRGAGHHRCVAPPRPYPAHRRWLAGGGSVLDQRHLRGRRAPGAGHSASPALRRPAQRCRRDLQDARWKSHRGRLSRRDLSLCDHRWTDPAAESPLSRRIPRAGARAGPALRTAPGAAASGRGPLQVHQRCMGARDWRSGAARARRRGARRPHAARPVWVATAARSSRWCCPRPSRTRRYW